MARDVENKTRWMLEVALGAVTPTVTVPLVLLSAVKMEDTAKRPSSMDSGHVDMEAALGMVDMEVALEMVDIMVEEAMLISHLVDAK